MFPEHKPGKIIRLGREPMQVYRELKAGVAAEDARHRHNEELRNQLKATMGDAETAIDAHDDEVIHWRTFTSKRVDVTRLRAERPEIAAEFVKPIQSRRFQPV